MKPLCALAVLVLVSMLGCGGEGQPPPPDAVTGVSVTGEDRVASQASTLLTAVVEGTGTISSEVTWSIESGGGTLSATTGGSVTYTAPFAREETAVTVQAVSQMDPSKSGAFTFTVARAPAGTLLEGTYVGTLSLSTELTTTSQPTPSISNSFYETTFTLERVSDTQVLLKPIPGFPQGIFVDILADDTLAIPPREGTRGVFDKYCEQQYFIGDATSGAPGTGSWDSQGALSLSWISRREQACNGPYGPGVVYMRTSNDFTGTKQ